MVNQNAPSIDNKLGMISNGRTHYFLQDHLGSTVGITDDGGNVIETNGYDSFGNPTNSTFHTRYQFTGREFDSFTGLQYSRARWYHPQIGRFISEDPIGFQGGDINLYGYVTNNPLMFRDPSGTFVPIVAGGVVVAILILTSPSYVNAPAPGDPVYRPDNPLLLNAAGGAAVGAVLGKVCRAVGPALGDFFGGASGSRIPANVPRFGYAPEGPLPSQNVGGVDIPLPHPAAQGPHTTLGTRIGSNGVPYRQSATFPGQTWPKANGQDVPWSRVDWTNHGRPWDHLSPHQHPFSLQPNGTWKLGSSTRCDCK
ncbi:MAG: RHS repeat-associated core domain-containing protein [Pyrinomonadaceae bacterium]